MLIITLNLRLGINKVSTELSKSGIAVSKSDFSACHRNSNKNKKVKDSKNKDVVLPQTITVRFNSSNKKDDVLKKYKNYDSNAKKHKKIRVII